MEPVLIAEGKRVYKNVQWTHLHCGAGGGGVAAELLSGRFLYFTGHSNDLIARRQIEEIEEWRLVGHRGSRRTSIGYFLRPNHDAEIACLPTCTGPDQLPRHARVRAGDMMRQKLEARAA